MSSRPAPGSRRSILVIAGLAVVAAVLIVVFFVRLSNQPGHKINVGSQEFTVGKAATYAPAVAKDGPLLFQALRGNELDIFVQHLGADPLRGWSAFEAHSPGEARGCLLRWRQASHDFADPCSARTFPANGAGLDQYAVRVDPKTNLVINLLTTLGTVPPATNGP
jgi:hypothetical protein